MAVSPLVVAGCAVAVTIKVVNAEFGQVQWVTDQGALERQVIDQIGRRVDQVMCPASVVVEVGDGFQCRRPAAEFVQAGVVSDQGNVWAEIMR
jgi:hypothetical protein